MGTVPIHENKKKKFVAALDQKLTTFRFELHNYLSEWEGHWDSNVINFNFFIVNLV